ncbi:NAD-dependent epimerase/dehydratase family protein [Streptomyces sp. NPDC020747]|uniref:NAD-dependent epimerase/dehydratase family protein n=1 Tax=Streptomyces sp. NPDC020747 TaxID=3365086 RepID=UPI0037BC2810
MTHPRRATAAEVIAARDPLRRIRVVTDPDPSGPPTALRTANPAWSCVGDDATHHVVFQDDVLIADGFFPYLEQVAAAVPGEAVAFYEGWEGRNSGVVRLGALTGAQWARAIDEHVPSLALMLPAEIAREYQKFAVTHGKGWPYDVVIQRYLKSREIPVRIAVPSTVDHDDVPSLAGNSTHGWRRATYFSERAVDVRTYDCAAFSVVPYYQYGEARCAVRYGTYWEHLDTDRYLRRVGLLDRCDTGLAEHDGPGLPAVVRRHVWLTAFATGAVVEGLTAAESDPAVADAVMDSLGPGGLCEEYTGAELMEMIPRIRALALTAFAAGRAARRAASPGPRATTADLAVTGGSAAFREQLARLLTDAGCAAVPGERPDPAARTVIHLADPHGRSDALPDLFADAERQGVRRLVLIASAAVYRGLTDEECTENAVSGRPPADAEARAWWDAEETCRRWGTRTGIPVQVVRIAEQVGPHAPLHGVLAGWMLRAWTRRPMELLNGRRHQIIDHRDMAGALAAILTAPVRSATYNVASVRYEENELAQLVTDTARATPWHPGTGADGAHPPLMSTALVTAETGWRPAADVHGGARAQAQWLACDTHDDVPGPKGTGSDG